MKKISRIVVISLIFSYSQISWSVETGTSASMKVNILDNTCAVDAKLGSVNLGPVALRDIKNNEGRSQRMPFTIVLKKCGIFARSVSIYIQGNSYPDRNDILKLSDFGTQDSAAGVGILLRDSMQNKMTINQTQHPVIEKLIAGGDTPLQFSAEYASTGEVLRSGRADAEVMFTFLYE